MQKQRSIMNLQQITMIIKAQYQVVDRWTLM